MKNVYPFVTLKQEEEKKIMKNKAEKRRRKLLTLITSYSKMYNICNSDADL